MLLQPRKFVFKTKHKKRRVLTWSNQNSLNYGDCGIKTIRPLRMSSRQIFRMKVVLKRAVRKSDNTRRYVWFNTFPHLPLTKKSKGMRMGKGVGKVNTWFTQLPGNVYIFEFKNLRRGRATKYFKRLRVKFPVPTIITHQNYRRISYVGRRKLNFSLRGFW